MRVKPGLGAVSEPHGPPPRLSVSFTELTLCLSSVQLSNPYMTAGKTITLTRWIFVDKVMSLLFNMLFTLIIAFLPRSKLLLISWLQSPFAVILEPPKIKSLTVSIASPSVFHSRSLLLPGRER